MDTTLISKSSGAENNTHLQSNCLLQTPQTRPTKFRKTSSNYDYMECVPGDVIVEILVRVPAQDIHNSARLVCRKWHNIIRTRDFKHAHLHQSTCGLVAQDVSLTRRKKQMTFIGSKADDDLIEISKLNCQSPHEVLSSCNGLLVQAHFSPRSLYITNPATERNLDLPPFFSNNRFNHGCAMAYVATTMEYKVVRSFVPNCFKPQAHRVAILTLGVDKDWTCRVNTQHLSLQAKELLLILFPLTTQGFVHWARDKSFVCWAEYERQYGHVLSLNVETEIITQFPVPSLRPSHGIGNIEVIFLPMGSYLSLLDLRSEFSWDFWEMKPETGEWTQMPSIDLVGLRNSDGKKLKPIGWLRPREVLVFSATIFSPPICFAFTVGTRKLQEFTLVDRIDRFLVHRNSLVWIN